MAAHGSAQQDPKVAATIGPYEELPGLSLEEGLDPLRLGTEGIWPSDEAEPVRWSDVRALSVTTLDDRGTTLAVLQAAVGSASADSSTPTRIAGMAFGLPDAEFEARARLIADRLLQYALDNGIDRAQWPTVDLTARPELSPAQRLERADAALTRLESICAHGTDPQLGRFVELRPDEMRLFKMILGAVVLAGSGVVLLLLSASPILEGRPGILIFGAILIAIGAWSVANILWLVLRWRRLRVGEKGLQLVPGSQPIMWRDVSEVDVSPDNVGLRLTITAASTDRSVESIPGGERTFRLAPLEVPGDRGARYREVTSLLESMLSASRTPE